MSNNLGFTEIDKQYQLQSQDDPSIPLEIVRMILLVT